MSTEARRVAAFLAMVIWVLLATTLSGRDAFAQGVTTGGFRGRIIGDADGDARVLIRHDATGAAVEVRASHGRFLVQGLQPGGPYTVTARILGYAPIVHDSLYLALGELRDVVFVLQRAVHGLMPVVTEAAAPPAHVLAGGGTGLTIGQAQLEHLPTLNRDLYDFVRLVPQISTRIGLSSTGMSAAGTDFRFNEFLIDGVSERTLSGGVSNAFSGARSIPLDAVQEYQVLLAPYDVRYGDFAGALVNAVTKSGTNTMRGSVFVGARNDQLARDAESSYDRAQYGFTLGGPLLHDRLHFFAAAELQSYTYPAPGPYAGQPPEAPLPVPVSTADLGRFDALMKGYGLDPGSAGRIENGNHLRNAFTRFDLALPRWSSRIVLSNNYVGSEDLAFSRTARDTFSLSSTMFTRVSAGHATSAHLHTTLGRPGGGHNELLVSQRADGLDAVVPTQQSIVRVSVPSVSGGRVTLNSGTPESAQGAEITSSGFRSSAFVVADNLTLPLGANHVLTLGSEGERYRLRRGIVSGLYGTWTFPSLDALEAGMADRYEARVDIDNPGAIISGTRYSAYAGDRWQPSAQLTLTIGVRGDMQSIDGRAPYNATVDSIFGRRTDATPRRRIELSPRVGFIWELAADGHRLLRGGAGVFTGRYPLAWAQTARTSYGVDSVIRCNRQGPALQRPPTFTPDYRTPPGGCIGGASVAPATPGDVDLLDPDLRMARMARMSLAHDWQLVPGMTLTNEVLLTRALSDFVFVNLNLDAPGTADAYGRVMYGTIAATGSATKQSRSAFAEVIDLRNTSANYSSQFTTRLEKKGPAGLSGSVAYTYSRVRDVQTPLRVNTRGTTAWASARVMAGRQDDLSASISSNDIPHRVIVASMWVSPWARWRTEVSSYLVAESGRPFTYVAFGTLGRGDLNADGSSANDPIYVPSSGAAEMLFSGVSDAVGADNSPAAQGQRASAQRAAFDAFVGRTDCLRRQRGQILARNSCREPWSSTTITSLRQVMPVAQRAVEVQIDAFNVLNLLNARWGLRREAVPALLEHVGQVVESADRSRPVFHFDETNTGWTTVPGESSFQLQLSMRYRF
jgi:hypothetical protein